MQNRIIKYRAWDRENKEMLQWESEVESEATVQTEFSLSEIGKDENYIFMEYTGLKDKDGKEIYEGDVVKSIRNGGVAEIIWTNDVASKYGEVKGLFGETVDLTGFLTTLGQFEFKYPTGKPHKSFHIQDTEVIGNIYENPELLTNQ